MTLIIPGTYQISLVSNGSSKAKKNPTYSKKKRNLIIVFGSNEIKTQFEIISMNNKIIEKQKYDSHRPHFLLQAFHWNPPSSTL